MSSILLCYFCNELITELNGWGSDSLVNHHISYSPEIKAPIHKKCHASYHNTHPDHPKDPAIDYKKIFIDNLGESAPCYFCDNPITKMNGRDSNSLNIHSLDGNHDNLDKGNKVPAHKGCHLKHHNEGDKNASKRPEVRAKISNAKMGHEVSEETRGKISKANTGRQHTEETKRKVGIAKLGNKHRLGTKHTEEAKRKISAAGMGRKQTEETKRKIGRANTGEKNGMYGKHHTDEFKRQRSDDWKGDKNPMKDPRIVKKVLDTKRLNNPNGKRMWKLRRERYGPTGRKPKDVKE